MNIQRCYEILEIDPHASPETVRQAYEDLLQAWNPEAFSKSPHLKKKPNKNFLKFMRPTAKSLPIHRLRQRPILLATIPNTPGFPTATLARGRHPKKGPSGVVGFMERYIHGRDFPPDPSIISFFPLFFYGQNFSKWPFGNMSPRFFSRLS
jgi:hypothetical protein